MGDRCYVNIEVRAKDVSKWVELGYDFEFEQSELEAIEDEVGSSVSLYCEERNYGVSGQDYDLVPDCPMYGYHGAGETYGPMAFAWDGKTFMRREISSDNGFYTKVAEDTGLVDEADLADLRKFLEFNRKVEELVGPLIGTGGVEAM